MYILVSVVLLVLVVLLVFVVLLVLVVLVVSVLLVVLVVFVVLVLFVVLVEVAAALYTISATALHDHSETTPYLEALKLRLRSILALLELAMI